MKIVEILLARIATPSALADVSARSVKILDVVWGQFVVAIATFAGIRVYTELLPQAEFGSAMLAMGGIAFLDGLMGMALSQTLLSRCAQILDEEARRQISVGLAIFASLAVSALYCAATLVLIATWIADLTPASWSTYPFILLVYTCSEFAKCSLLSLLMVGQRYRKTSLWFAGEAILVLIFTIITLKFWRTDASGYVIGYVLARIVSTIIFISFFARNHLKGVKLSQARREVKTAIGYGAPVAFMAPLGWLATYLDRYILGAMLGAGSTGAYAAATGLVTRPYALTTNVLTNYFRPQLFRSPEASIALGDEFWRRKLMWRWIISAMCIGGGGALAFLVLSDPITRLLLAADYRDSALEITVIFACAQTFAIMTHGADNALLAMGRSRALLKLQLGLSATTLILVPLGIYSGGTIGAVAGRCLAEGLKLIGTATLVIILSRSPTSDAAPAEIAHSTDLST